jgi:DNA primase
MRIPRHFIDTVINRTDIVDLIDSYVSLKKAGSEFEACCPFHKEETPSFKVSPSKQIYHCFGCGANGNGLTFMMEHQHLEFVEAVQELAARAGLEMEYEAGTTPTVTEDEIELYDILTQAAEFFQQQLTLPQAGAAQEYLQYRELNQQIVQEFGIGYAPAGWDNLLNTFGDSPRHRALLLKAGLIKTPDEGHAYDFFRNRLMFPIHDARGRVIAFGGRVLVDSKKEAKYLNSPESSVFQKSHTLYGWHLVRQQRALSRVIVVEGYMDVVALAQYGIRHAVATLGTATSSEHIKQLFRRVPEVIFSFDGDEAGKKAAWKALEISLPVLQDGKVISFAFLPQGDDPDSFVRREGMEAFYAYLDQAVPLSQLLFDTQMSRFNLRILEGQVQFVEVMNGLLARLTPGVFQDSLKKRLQELVPSVDTQKLDKPTRKSQSTPQSDGGIDGIVSSLLDKGLRLLVQQPHFAHSITAYREPSLQTLHHAEIPHTAEQQREYFFWKLLDFCRSHQEVTTGRLVEQYRDTPEQDLIFTFGQWKHLLQNEEDRKQEFLSIVAALYHRGEFPFCDGYRIKQLSHKWSHGQLTDSERQEFIRLTGKRHESANN